MDTVVESFPGVQNNTATAMGFRGIVESLHSISYWKLFFTVVCVGLVYDQISYQIKKGSIAGPKWKMWPILGPFLESLDPKFEEYKAKWDSGPLSCVSIFHKFVVIASTRDYARKILQSSKYVKPCLLYTSRCV